MKRMRWGGALVSVWLMLCCAGVAQLATTTVSDTVYGASGNPAQGTVLISWPEFTAQDGSAVAGGSTTVTLDSKGGLSVALAPNAGSDPIGSYYTVQYHLSDGTVTRENWVVPVASTPVTLAAIRSTVMPLSVAMQTVSKNYVDRAIAKAVAASKTTTTGTTIDTSNFVQAKPAGTQTVSQPAVNGTQTYQFVNALNGVKYASQFASGGSNGIANAFGSTAGVTVIAEPTYSTSDSGPASYPNQSHLMDYRQGALSDLFTNPALHTTSTEGNWYTGRHQSSMFTTMPAAGGSFADEESTGFFYAPGEDNGYNGTSATGWSVHTMHSAFDYDFMRGISGGYGFTLRKHSTGDSQAFGSDMRVFGGTVAASDEGVTPLEIEMSQNPTFPSGTCTAGCTAGSTQITASVANGPFDNGGYLLDVTQGGTNTATISAIGETSFGSGSSALYYDLTGITLTPSTAWGNIVPSSCTNNGHGVNQNYTTTTCTVMLGTLPASPGKFVAGQDIFLSGRFEEETAVAAVADVVAGVSQSITFNTRYAWDSANGNTLGAVVMQGGIFGSGGDASQGFIQTGTSAWPISYPVVGALTATRLIFGNCAFGICNGDSSTQLSHNLLRAGGITFYPQAEIIGTGLGQNNVANLGTNTIPFASGDTVWGSPAAEFHYRNLIAYGQTTPLDPADASIGLMLADSGPVPALQQLRILNNAAAATTMIRMDGEYGPGINFSYRPQGTSTVPGDLILVGGADGSTLPYNIFRDGAAASSSFSFNPATSQFTLPNLIIGSAFTAGSNVGTDYIQLTGSSGAGIVNAVTANSYASLNLNSKGSGTVNLGNGSSDYVAITGGSGTSTISVNGSSANDSLVLQAKGTGLVSMLSANPGTIGSWKNTSSTGITGFSTNDNSGNMQGVFGYNIGYTGLPATVGKFFFLAGTSPMCFSTSSTGSSCDLSFAASQAGATFSVPVSMSSKKITMLANGSATTDAVAYGQIAAVGFSGSASDMSAGTLADARLSSNVPLLNAATNSYTGNIVTSARIAPQQATPATSSAACTAGQMWTDANYIYVCTGTNTIKRAALSSF